MRALRSARGHRRGLWPAFSLLELLLALALGMLLSGVMLQALLAEGQNSSRLSRLLRERAAQRRTLELVKLDLRRATALSPDPAGEQPACGLGGRLAVLHLSTPAGPITYSVGAAPSGIWRGRVLLRCGPAFGLDGEPALGSQAQNRVVIDGLDPSPGAWGGCGRLLAQAGGPLLDLADSSAQPFSACLAPASGLVALRLQQQLAGGGAGRPQTIAMEVVAEVVAAAR